MEKVTFQPKFGKSFEVEPEEVKDVERVNGKCSEIIVSKGNGREKIRVKGSYYKVMNKLDREVKPEGLEKVAEDGGLRNDRKLKKFFN